MSTRDLISALDLRDGVRRVWQILQEEPTLQYKKMKEAPLMTENSRTYELNGRMIM